MQKARPGLWCAVFNSVRHLSMQKAPAGSAVLAWWRRCSDPHSHEDRWPHAARSSHGTSVGYAGGAARFWRAHGHRVPPPHLPHHPPIRIRTRMSRRRFECRRHRSVARVARDRVQPRVLQLHAAHLHGGCRHVRLCRSVLHSAVTILGRHRRNSARYTGGAQRRVLSYEARCQPPRARALRWRVARRSSG